MELPAHFTEDSLTSSGVYQRGLAAALIAFGLGLTIVPAASADPTDAAPTDATDPGPAAVYPAADPVTVPVDSADPDSPAVAACSQFASALDAASTYYGDFADNIEGTEHPDYGDPTISDSNTMGRTALREASALAMNAANTPGVTPDIADPMRSWSVGATKLLLKMGLRVGGQSLNDTATAMNTDASNAQMACAAAGTHA
jgi:hypothetical protein